MTELVDSLGLEGAQRDAVAARGADVLVTAGAGSGKTRTLVARYMALLDEGLQPRQIVAVTFTEKAAREMRNRIRAAIEDWRTGKCPPAERARWDEVEADIDAARIGTIHSLCASLIRAHPAEAGIDPLVSVLDENLAVTLKARAVEDALIWSIGQAGLEALFDIFGVDELRSVLADLLANRLEAPSALAAEVPERWRRAIVATMKEFAGNDDVTGSIELMRRLRDSGRLEADAGDKLAAQIIGLLRQWEVFEQALETGDYFAAACSLHTARRDHTALSAGRRTSQARAALQQLRREYESAIEPWLGGSRSPEPDGEIERQAGEAVGLISRLFAEAANAYQAAKDMRQAVDFDDLEMGAARLLEKPEVRTRWQKEVAALLVDEFQDTNERQRKIIESLAGSTGGANGKLFVVGDAKQSIYRFRGADVSVFRRIGDDIRARGGQSIALDITFRAHCSLVETLNELLSPILGQSDDSSRPYAVPFAPLQSKRTEVRPGIKEPFVEILYGLGDDVKTARPAAARMLARRLLDLHDHELVQWQEIALLFRSAAGFPPYEDALEGAGIPFVTVAGKGFYDRPEIRDILNILRALADPWDDLAMAGLLRSPAFGLSDAALYELRWSSLENSSTPRSYRLALRVQGAMPPAGVLEVSPRNFQDLLTTDLDRQQAERARQIIDDLSGMVDRVTVAELIKAMFDQTLYRAMLGADAMELRLQRNTDKLLADASASGLVRVAEYLEYVETLREGGAREGEAPAEAGGAVRLMTVHRAKGLEFPVVVIADAARGGPSSHGAALLSNWYGFVPAPRRFERKPLVHGLAKALDADQDECEERRLLYVAATRAKDKLLICGHKSKGSDSWLAKLATAAGLDLDGLSDTPGDWQEITLPQSGQKIAAVASIEGAEASETRETEGEVKIEPASGLAPLYKAIPLERTSEVATTDDPAEFQIRRITGRRHRDGTIVGTLVHEALRYWRFPDDPVLERLLRTAALTEGLVERSDVDEHIRQASALLTRFQSDPRWPEIDAARRWHEVPYSLKRGDLASLGVIDILYQSVGKAGNWCIIDVKTDQIPDEEQLRADIERYASQLRKYGHAVATLLGGQVETVICFLDFVGATKWEVVS